MAKSRKNTTRVKIWRLKASCFSPAPPHIIPLCSNHECWPCTRMLSHNEGTMCLQSGTISTAVGGLEYEKYLAYISTTSTANAAPADGRTLRICYTEEGPVSLQIPLVVLSSWFASLLIGKRVFCSNNPSHASVSQEGPWALFTFRLGVWWRRDVGHWASLTYGAPGGLA